MVFQKKTKLRPIGRNGVRPIDRPRRAVDGVKPIDTGDLTMKGTSGVRGRVGRKVKAIDKPVRNIYDPLS